MAAGKAKSEVVADQRRREVFPSPEWFDECDRQNLGLIVRLYGIERVAARLIEGLPDTIRSYRSACESVETWRSFGFDDSSSYIQNEWAKAEEARRQRIQWEDWLRKVADQAATYLPELNLPNITQKPVGLDSAEKQKPILEELEKIKAAAIQQRVLAESNAAKSNVPIKLVDGGDRTKWTIWLQTKTVKPVFAAKRAVGKSPQAWTDFANGLRAEGLLENHPIRGPKEVKIHKSVFTKFEIDYPNWFEHP